MSATAGSAIWVGRRKFAYLASAEMDGTSSTFDVIDVCVDTNRIHSGRESGSQSITFEGRSMKS